MRLKAFALDYFLASLTLGLIFTPLIGLLGLLASAGADGAVVLIGFVSIAIGIVVGTVWVTRRYDLPFPPWRPRCGRDTPGKRRYPVRT